jgi:integrase
VYKLHSNGKYWQAVLEAPEGKRVRRSLGPKALVSKRAAQKLVNNLIVDAARRPQETADERLLADWLERYLKIRAREISGATLAIHKRTVRLLNRFFGERPIESLTRAQMADWREWLAEEQSLGESTVCKHVRTAKVIFSTAIDHEWIRESPAIKLKGAAPIQDPFSRRMISDEEIEKVLTKAGEVRPIIGLCFYAGLRTQEAIHLKHADLEPSGNLLRVVPRGGVITTKQRGREVRVEPALSQLLPQAPDNPQLTVSGMLEAGRKNMVSRLVREACCEAGVSPFVLRDLRRTRDTLWHKKYPSHICCAWLGHSESVARQHYLGVPSEYYEH